MVAVSGQRGGGAHGRRTRDAGAYGAVVEVDLERGRVDVADEEGHDHVRVGLVPAQGDVSWRAKGSFRFTTRPYHSWRVVGRST